MIGVAPPVNSKGYQALSAFRFQQFAVAQFRSGMKVCTDATLFGAMAPVAGGASVLDIGTGTGLLALMTAQLCADRVMAVELTAEAALEASDNFAASPWRDRLVAVHADIRAYAARCTERFDLVISNPPFFTDHSRAQAPLRNIARHTDSLPLPDLISAVDRVLAPGGLFYVLVPGPLVLGFTQVAASAGLHLSCRTDLRAFAHSPAKVAALSFSRTPGVVLQRDLTIYTAPRVYSAASAHYLAAFLLRFAGV